GTVCLWEPAAGKALRRWRGHKGPVRGVAFAPDGKSLASGGGDARICLWDLAEGTAKPPPRTRTLTHESRVTSLAFAPDGRVIASGSGEGTVHLWEVETGSKRWEAGQF